MDPCEDDDHTPDWNSVVRADVTVNEPIVDVWCSICGQSGSIMLDPTDIQW